MQPSDEVLGKVVDSSPEGWVVIALTIVAVLFVLVRYALPLIKELREKRMEVERYRIEVDERAAQALDDRERERIKATQAQIEQQRQTNEALKTISASLDASTAHTDVLVAELQGSRERSHEMGGKVERIAETTTHTDGLVEEMHAIIVRREGTD